MTQALATLRNSGALVVLVVTYVVFSIAAPSFLAFRTCSISFMSFRR